MNKTIFTRFINAKVMDLFMGVLLLFSVLQLIDSYNIPMLRGIYMLLASMSLTILFRNRKQTGELTEPAKVRGLVAILLTVSFVSIALVINLTSM